jgi:hypothetical protein
MHILSISETKMDLKKEQQAKILKATIEKLKHVKARNCSLAVAGLSVIAVAIPLTLGAGLLALPVGILGIAAS